MSQISIKATAGGGGGPIDTLTGNNMLPVSPTAGNINIFGGAGATVVGTPVNSTLTINVINPSVGFTVTTNDDTPTELFNQPLLITTGIIISAQIIATTPDYSLGYAGRLTFGAIWPTAAGGPIEIGAPELYQTSNYVPGPLTIPEVNAVIVGNSVVIQVIGQAGTTYNWSAFVQAIVQTIV